MKELLAPSLPVFSIKFCRTEKEEISFAAYFCVFSLTAFLCVEGTFSTLTACFQYQILPHRKRRAKFRSVFLRVLLHPFSLRFIEFISSAENQDAHIAIVQKRIGLQNWRTLHFCLL